MPDSAAIAFAKTVAHQRKALVSVTDRAARALAASLEDVKQKALKRLRELKKLEDAQGELDTKNVRVKRSVQAALADVKDMLHEGLNETQDALDGQRTTAFKQAYLESAKSAAAYQGEKFVIGGSFGQGFREAIKISQRMPVIGLPPGDETRGARRWTDAKLRDALTETLVKGKGVDWMASKVADIADVSERAATRIARTNLNAVQNNAHWQVIQDNPDIFDGGTWDSVLDGRTSEICLALHGRFFALDEEPPGPPAHPNCRSQIIPHFRDEETQDLVDEESTRRVKNADGEYETIPADETTDEWLAKQPKTFQEEMLSETKAQLFSDGYLTLDDMVWPDLTPRTDDEAIQLALAKNPADRAMRALAQEQEVAYRPLAAIRTEEKRMVRRAPFDQGEKL